MNFRQLEFFSAVAETGSMSAAAQKLHIAQPPISRQISMLEDELNVQLFLRSNKGVTLTDAGYTLYQQCQEVFQNCREMIDSVRSVSAGIQGQLKVGTIYSDLSVAIKCLKEYHQQYPLVELYIRVGTPGDLLSDLEQSKLHFLFLRSLGIKNQRIEKKILGTEPLELVLMPQLDPAPDCKAVPLERLRDVPMCLLRSDDLWRYGNDLLEACQKLGFSPRIVCQCYDTTTELHLIQAGFGIGYLPRSIVELFPSSGLYTKPVEGLNSVTYPSLVWLNKGYYSGSMRAFLTLFGGLKEPDARAVR